MKKMTIILSLLAAMLLAAQEQTLIVRMVRHGQPGVQGTDFTPADKQKWIGLGLTPLGRKQAEVTGQFLKKEGIQWEKVIASPQERASETADIICGILGKTFTLEPRLREIGNPIREPLPSLRKRFKNLAPDAVLDLTDQQRKSFRESNRQQGERGRDFIMSLFKTSTKGPVLLVTHGNFMYTTILEMTGQSFSPWNCGMAELKVRPDGRAELVKGVYPEVMPAELITCNKKIFLTNPWYFKFLPYPGARPDAAALLNREFGNLLSGQKSSWDRKRGTPAKLAASGGGKLSLQGGKSPSAVVSPCFPLKAGMKYRLLVTASGNGSAVIRLTRSPWQKKIELTPENKEYELEFSMTRKKSPWYEILLEAAPESKMTVTGLTFSQLE